MQTKHPQIRGIQDRPKYAAQAERRAHAKSDGVCYCRANDIVRGTRDNDGVAGSLPGQSGLTTTP